jgi:SNF2 family DNA or RNA helicase
MMSMIDLFPFQKDDVEYLGTKQSVLIANEMGTGKTYEAIARDLLIRDGSGGDTLVIGPLTILENVWKKHFDDLTDLWTVAIDPKRRQESWEAYIHCRKRFGAAGVFCVHWEALRLMPELAEWRWSHIIADECHRAKNHKAQQTRALKKLKTQYKTAMSGTPVVNRPDELWSILNWLYPKHYGSYWRFVNSYCDFDEKYAYGRRYKEMKGPRNLSELHREMKPFFVRRLKKDVLPELPDKYHQELKVELDPPQRRIYNEMRKNMIAWIGQQEDEVLPAPVVIAQLTRLQQFSCAYAELSSEGRVVLREPSSKLDAVMEVLDETEDQVVVFSRFKQLVNLLADRLQRKHIPYVSFTGDTPQMERAALVERFQKGQARVFIGTVGAGGIGITLHAASTVVFLDRDWSPALNLQAEDRLHRIGQYNAVQVIDIVARDTVDLGKLQMLDLKKSWIRAMLGDK